MEDELFVSRNLKRSLLGAAALSVLSVAPLAAARAETLQASTQVDVSLKASTLGDALRAFSAQAGVSVMFSERQVAGRRVEAMAGTFAPDAAILQILKGTGLEAVKGQGGAYVLREAVSEGTPGTSSTNDESEVAPERVAADDPAPDTPELRADTVIVTGTSLRGIAPESSPLQIYSREDILGSGVTTTEQFIRTLPQNFGGGSNEYAPGGFPNDISSRQNYTFGTGANLRGLGSRGTLVLLDGERLAPASGIGDFVDLSLIPVSALGRVDVLTDGASSIYGGDAVAGVINFVLRDEFEGAETSLRYGTIANGGMEEIRFGQALGTTWGSGSVLAIYEAFKRGALTLADRPSLAPPQLLSGGAIANPGDFELLPEQARQSAILSVRQQLGERLSLTGSGFYAERSAESATVVAGATSTFATSDTRSTLLAVSGRAAYDLAPGWLVSASASVSEVANDETLRSFVTPDPVPTVSDFSSGLSSFDVRLSGDVMAVPGGVVKAAAGVHLRREAFDFETRGFGKIRDGERDVSAVYGEVQVPIISPVNALPGIERLDINVSGRVDDYSDFGTSANPKVGLLYSPGEDLRFRASYSTSFSPPALGRSGALDRTGSVFPYAFIRSRLGIPLVDPSLATVDYLVTGGTQANLDAETSRAFTAGVDQAFTTGRHNFKLNATYYDIDFEGRLGTTPIPGNINLNFAPNIAFTDPAALPAGTVLFFPSQAEIDALLATFTRPPTLVAGATLGNIGIVNNASVVRNLASTRTSGVDVGIGYDTDLALATFSAGLNASYLLRFDQQAAETTPEISTLNTLFNPVDLNLKGRVGLSRGGFTGTMFINYTAAYRTDDTASSVSVRDWTTADLSLAYAFREDQDGPLRGTRIALSVTNLFDEDPPATPANGLFKIAGYDPANASPLGRFIAVEISKAF
ncbi:MAG: TonB-dependent receptor domain-containing protein [Pannonibacter sp.]